MKTQPLFFLDGDYVNPGVLVAVFIFLYTNKLYSSSKLDQTTKFQYADVVQTNIFQFLGFKILSATSGNPPQEGYIARFKKADKISRTPVKADQACSRHSKDAINFRGINNIIAAFYHFEGFIARSRSLKYFLFFGSKSPQITICKLLVS